MDNDSRITKPIVYLYTSSGDDQPSYKPGLLELSSSTLVKLRYRNGQHYSGILKVSLIARWKGRQGTIFLVDLESIQHKLSSDYSLNIYFSLRFPYIDGPLFSPYKPLQNVDFSKVGNMQLFFRDCTHIFLHIYSRTQGKSLRICFS